VKDDVTKKLREPFSRVHIGKLPKVYCKKCTNSKVQCDEHKPTKCRTCKAYVSPAHLHVDFVGHAHITERLLDVDPEWNWEPMGLDSNGLPLLDEYGGLWIRLTVDGLTRVGYGDADGRKGGDATKAAISDAIKVAAMRFGVALDLWKKEGADAPETVAKPRSEEATVTPAQRAGQLRGLIATIGKQDDKTIDDIAAEFREWSSGKEINTASVAVLSEYLAHIQAEP
jgi:hypothetical protein